MVLAHFLLKENQCFDNGLPKRSPDCHILCNQVFDNFILADELFAKALRSL